jgi:hypothetical protein
LRCHGDWGVVALVKASAAFKCRSPLLTVPPRAHRPCLERGVCKKRQVRAKRQCRKPPQAIDSPIPIPDVLAILNEEVRAPPRCPRRYWHRRT